MSFQTQMASVFRKTQKEMFWRRFTWLFSILWEKKIHVWVKKGFLFKPLKQRLGLIF